MGTYEAEGVWTEVVAIANPDTPGWTLPINGTGSGSGNGKLFTLTVGPTNNGQYAPAACTIQIMNGEAIQTSSGMVEISRLTYIPDLVATSDTWEDYTSAAMALNPPRLCSAAKLALRGVTTDLLPYNMSTLSNFTRSDRAHGSNVVNLGTIGLDFEGFAPCLVRNPDKVQLTYLVTVEYRVRFDPSNPACASHIHHHAVPEGVWDHLVSAMSNEGHGIVDIADVVAETGEAVGSAIAAHA